MRLFVPRLSALAQFLLTLSVAGHCAAQNWDRAYEILRSRLSSEKRYPRFDCISFGLTEAKGTRYDIEVREKHEGSCGGDPDVAPIVDRYRVDTKTKTIWHYDPLDDEYLPYDRSTK